MGWIQVFVATKTWLGSDALAAWRPGGRGAATREGADGT